MWYTYTLYIQYKRETRWKWKFRGKALNSQLQKQNMLKGAKNGHCEGLYETGTGMDEEGMKKFLYALYNEKKSAFQNMCVISSNLH